MPEIIPPAYTVDLVLEQTTYLFQQVLAGKQTPSEFDRLMRVRDILLEPFESKIYKRQGEVCEEPRAA